jgi:pyruvate formate lyase activating enzyme
VSVKGFLDTSFIDWPGKLSAVVFLPGCNFRCPFCHNPELIGRAEDVPDVPFEKVLERLGELTGWVEGVVVSGGEPTLHRRLPELLRAFRSAGLAVKLDTNGSRPAVIADLVKEDLVQAVDMDLKAPFERGSYCRLAGVDVDPETILASMDLVVRSGVSHRFRTTVVPGLLDRCAVERIASRVPVSSEYILQAFEPRRVLDPALADARGPTDEEMSGFREAVSHLR